MANERDEVETLVAQVETDYGMLGVVHPPTVQAAPAVVRSELEVAVSVIDEKLDAVRDRLALLRGERKAINDEIRQLVADVAVLELDNPASNARAKIGAEIARALDEDHAEAIVLGCAGMADLAASLSAEFGVPVIDGVAAAVVVAEGLAAIGLRTSKRGGYAKPLTKTYSGLFERFSPKG